MSDLKIIYILITTITVISIITPILFFKLKNNIITSLDLFESKLSHIEQRLSPEEQKNLQAINEKLINEIKEKEKEINESQNVASSVKNENKALKNKIELLYNDIAINKKIIDQHSKIVEIIELDVQKAERVIKDNENTLSIKDSQIRELQRKLSGSTLELELIKRKLAFFDSVTKKKSIIVAEKTIGEIINILKHSPSAENIVNSLIAATKPFHHISNNEISSLNKNDDWSVCKACGSTSPDLCRCSE